MHWDQDISVTCFSIRISNATVQVKYIYGISVSDPSWRYFCFFICMHNWCALVCPNGLWTFILLQHKSVKVHTCKVHTWYNDGQFSSISFLDIILSSLYDFLYLNNALDTSRYFIWFSFDSWSRVIRFQTKCVCIWNEHGCWANKLD